MRAKDIVGKRVTKVNQRYWTKAEGAHTPGWIITGLEFEDGTVLLFGTVEGECDYGTSALVLTGAASR